MSKARTRLVNFRLTDEEFEQLKAASSQQGARCVSDFVRFVILTPANRCPSYSACDESFLTFEKRVTALERSMTRFIEAISGSQPRRANLGN